jgi:hypothetical protein
MTEYGTHTITILSSGDSYNTRDEKTGTNQTQAYETETVQWRNTLNEEVTITFPEESPFDKEKVTIPPGGKSEEKTVLDGVGRKAPYLYKLICSFNPPAAGPVVVVPPPPPPPFPGDKTR